MPVAQRDHRIWMKAWRRALHPRMGLALTLHPSADLDPGRGFSGLAIRAGFSCGRPGVAPSSHACARAFPGKGFRLPGLCRGFLLGLLLMGIKMMPAQLHESFPVNPKRLRAAFWGGAWPMAASACPEGYGLPGWRARSEGRIGVHAHGSLLEPSAILRFLPQPRAGHL
jgi:hypothetical protein